jgi:hypothetical protein
MTRKLTKPVAKKPMVSTAPPALIADLRELIAEARQSVAATVNAGLTLLYWRIGKRIVNEVLGHEPRTASRLSYRWHDNWLTSMAQASARKICAG